VDTGNTLKANNLVALELIQEISSRLIVNSAAFNTKHKAINQWIQKIEQNL
jgi:ATP phosphoribosyltransferase